MTHCYFKKKDVANWRHTSHAKITHRYLPKKCCQITFKSNGHFVLGRPISILLQLIVFNETTIVFIKAQVMYEPVNPISQKQTFEQHFSAAPTFMFMHKNFQI